jgi:DNA-binding NarL/FixJ family response regulator
MLKSGAYGYVLKNAGKGEIGQVIQAIMPGCQYLGAEIGLALLQQALNTPTAPQGTADKTSKLAKRELEVLQLLADGMTNAEIAEKPFTSKRTVETHRQNIIEIT